MAHLPRRNTILTGEVIKGRPDHGGNHDFGRTLAITFPPFVYSTRRLAALMHTVDAVELDWWAIGPGGHSLHRVASPLMIARTRCGTFFRLEAGIAKTCKVASSIAVPCAACTGRGRNFKRERNQVDAVTGVPRAWAQVALGCHSDDAHHAHVEVVKR